MTSQQLRETVDALYRSESRRVFATLIRLLGDFDLAEEAVHEAFRAALEQWRDQGIPGNPRAWLVSTGRNKAIDSLRRSSRWVHLPEELQIESGATSSDAVTQFLVENHQTVELQWWDDEHLEDDRLRLVFTCCHPALSAQAQVALTLREVCGLTTEEIAHAFLVTPTTLAQRIVRAKAKIRAARIPYQVPGREDLPQRLNAVLRVVYLAFNEGYFASHGDALTRADLSEEAIRLGRLLLELLPEPEVMGLLALMLFQESRRCARTSAQGELILLDEQDRSLWNREWINEASELVQQSLKSRRYGPYALQAAIAAVHAEADNAAATDWRQIVGLYDVLLQIDPSPVVELNRAVAIAMRDGPLAGLTLIEQLMSRGDLSQYHLAHAAVAELSRRLGKTPEARRSFEMALSLARQETERRFLQKRIQELEN